ncbi:hypothetical protein LSP04_05860 [Levilactobacillus spicheri]|uniref:Transposase n=1 Tax=Levilactobacillus spicheri TaxID=216463 RepID=A0ABQ0WMF0_9LACO|nr:hypothetical protein LSP04_05860 [Levilactobacillus spicheri]
MNRVKSIGNNQPALFFVEMKALANIFEKAIEIQHGTWYTRYRIYENEYIKTVLSQVGG